MKFKFLHSSFQGDTAFRGLALQRSTVPNRLHECFRRLWNTWKRSETFIGYMKPNGMKRLDYQVHASESKDQLHYN